MLIYFVIVVLGVLAIMSAIEIASLPRASDVDASRSVPRLEESELAEVKLHVQIKDDAARLSKRAHRLMIQDDAPPQLCAARNSIATNAEQSGRYSYQVSPKSRGNVEFGDIHLRVTGPLHLFWAQFKIPAKTPVSVWPNTRLTTDKHAALQKALRLEGARIRHFGIGLAEFAHIREYAQGDDPRQVNWFATARRQTLMRNVYEPERGQNVILAIDCGRSMAVMQNAGKTRLDLALEAALLTAQVAFANGDEINVIAYSNEVHLHLSHLRGKSGMRQLIESTYDLTAHIVYSDPHIMADLVYAHHKRHALLILLTDLTDLSTNDLFEQNIRVLEKHHTCLVASFTDEALEEAITKEAGSFAAATKVAIAAGLLNDRKSYRDRLFSRHIEVVEARQELYTEALKAYVRYKNAAR